MVTMQAQRRSITGKKVKNLRKQGLLPANVYGPDMESQALELNAHDFFMTYRSLPMNSVVQLAVDGGEPYPARIGHTQYNVRTGLATHVEFIQVR